MEGLVLQMLDKKELSERDIKQLRQICWWADGSPATDIYTLKDNDDIKSVFVLKMAGDKSINTRKDMDFGTKKEARGKGYARAGFSLLLEEIIKRPDIRDVQIQSFNPVTSKIVAANMNENFARDGMGTAIFTNPNFDAKYQKLCDGIQNGSIFGENVESFCGDDKYMLKIAESLLATSRQFKARAPEPKTRS